MTKEEKFEKIKGGWYPDGRPYYKCDIAKKHVPAIRSICAAHKYGDCGKKCNPLVLEWCNKLSVKDIIEKVREKKRSE